MHCELLDRLQVAVHMCNGIGNSGNYSSVVIMFIIGNLPSP